jgi:hypothetical protein
MAKATNQKQAIGSALEFEAQIRLAHRRQVSGGFAPNLKAHFMPVRKDAANPPFDTSNWGDKILGRTRAGNLGLRSEQHHA